MPDEKEMKVVFEPGCFDSFEGTQEELDEFVAELRKMVETGDLFKNAKPVTDEDLDDLPEKVREDLIQWMERDITDPRDRKLN